MSKRKSGFTEESQGICSNEEKSSHEIVDALVTQKDKNEKLVKLCFAEVLDWNAIVELLRKGAEAGYKQRKDGTWGAFQTRSAIHGVLQGKHWVNCEKATLAIAVLAELFKCGANPNAEESHSDWRGSGGSTSAFKSALSIVTCTVLKEHDDLSSSLIKMFLEAGVDINKENYRSIASMRADGVIKSTFLHNNFKSYRLPIIRQLLQKADVDRRKTETINHERGHDQDSSNTALHILCSSMKRQNRDLKDDKNCLQLAAVLLEFDADPNSLNTHLRQIENPEWHDDMTDDPRKDGYISEVISERVIETPLYYAIKNGLAPLVWLLIIRGARTKCIYISCLREDFPSKRCAKVCEIEEAFEKFHVQDRKSGDVVLSAFQVLEGAKKELENSLKEENLKKKLNTKHKDLKYPEKFWEDQQAMKTALRGEWSKSFYPYASDETQKLIVAIQKSRLQGVVQDLVITFVLSMYPLSSNLF